MPISAGQRKKKSPMIAFIMMLLSSTALATLFVNLAKANPYLYTEFISPPLDVKPPTISIDLLKNNTLYASNNISLTLNVSIPETEAKTKYHLSISGIWYQLDLNDSFVAVYAYSGSGSVITDFSGDLTLTDMLEGYHNVTFMASVTGGYPDGLTWYWFDLKSYSTMCFSVDTVSPSVSILSLKNITYETSDVPLNFIVNEPVAEVSYSLDEQSNVTVAGNTTLAGLPVGMHNITVYAWDTVGNLGSSETVTFTITEPKQEPSPAVPVAAASMASAAVVLVGLLMHFKKRKH